jgi:hypothetical protein
VTRRVGLPIADIAVEFRAVSSRFKVHRRQPIAERVAGVLDAFGIAMRDHGK